MQVVIKRSDLMSAPPDGVPVFATYDDNVTVDLAAQGEGVMVLSGVPSNAVTEQIGSEGFKVVLTGNWREERKVGIVSSESTRRIDEVFPEYSQRNSNAEMNGYIVQYGADANRWPTAARDRKTEIDRCWSYVEAIRKANRKLTDGALPLDPTADSLWPTRIAPYKPW